MDGGRQSESRMVNSDGRVENTDPGSAQPRPDINRSWEGEPPGEPNQWRGSAAGFAIMLRRAKGASPSLPSRVLSFFNGLLRDDLV